MTFSSQITALLNDLGHADNLHGDCPAAALLLCLAWLRLVTMPAESEQRRRASHLDWHLTPVWSAAQ